MNLVVDNSVLSGDIGTTDKREMCVTKIIRSARMGLLALAGFASVAITGIVPASAQESAMSCYDLWYQRNSIYARYGYCFKTQRAISVFGPGCHPPYGNNMSPYDAQRVQQLQYWERSKGCS